MPLYTDSDSSMDYLRYPTFGPLPSCLRSKKDTIRCKNGGIIRFLLRQSDMKPICADCGTEIMPAKPAAMFRLSRPEKPLFQIVNPDHSRVDYILHPDGTVRTLNRHNCKVETAFSGDHIVSIASGNDHVVALRSDGTVAALGDNNLPQCQVQDWTDIVAIAATHNGTFGLRSDGTVVTTHSGEWAEQFKSWSEITAIAASKYKVIGVRSNGTIISSGWEDDAECRADEWTDIKQIAVSFGYTAGLTKNGTVRAVGFNGNGQCDVGSWRGITAIYSDGILTCGLREDGSILATCGATKGTFSVLDRILYNELAWIKRSIESWKNVEQLALAHNFIAALHRDGSFSFLVMHFGSPTIRRPMLQRALKKALA